LNGPHQRFAVGVGLARYYPRDMAPFAGIENGSPAAYTDLAAGLPTDTEARLFRPADESLPEGWVKVDAFPMLQMVATHTPSVATSSEQSSTLSLSDVGAMIELVNVAKPGPFGRRTPELGRYVGVWDNGRLIAMAGERLRPRIANLGFDRERHAFLSRPKRVPLSSRPPRLRYTPASGGRA